MVDAKAWDERYAATELMWSVDPNQFVARECADLDPGRALDLACGEGRNAIWLARRGWQVTATDFSAVALDKGRRLAGDLALDWVVADATTWQPDGTYDLTVLAYLQLAAPERRHAHRLAAAALAPGGTFLLVAHHTDNLTEGVGGPQDPAVLFTPDEVVADLEGTGLIVDRAERVERVVAAEGAGTHRADGSGGGVALDVLVRAHRESR